MHEITRTWRVVAPRFTAMFVLALSLSGLHAATTYAATTSGYRVTFVARHCASYTDVTANLARNDIQESLRDLGADTAYVSGQEIDVDIERANQPRCTAITGWQFKLGTGIGGRDTGTFGSLSKVSNPDATLVRTKASTPLFDRYGASTGRTVAGATTVTLTAAQVERATRRQLWSQGGVPGDPVLNATFPDEYGFAALRCAIDNLNGDNVEFIAFPSGVTHVVCYAYYVTPPPTSGEIVIEKSLTDVGADDRYDESFAYDSNLTYDPSNRFTVDVVDNAMGRRSCSAHARY